MYLSNDKELLECYKEYFKSKKDEDINNYKEAIYGYNFFSKMCVSFDVVTLIIDKLPYIKKVDTPYGDYNSKIMILLDRNTNNKEFNLLKDIVSKSLGIDISNLYVTYFNKINKDDLTEEENNTLMLGLKKELITLKPKTLFNFSSFSKECFSFLNSRIFQMPYKDLHKIATFENSEGMNIKEVELIKNNKKILFDLFSEFKRGIRTNE